MLAQTLAKTLKVPFAVTDATTLTEAGYVGEDVENILLRLIQAADYDIEKAERGIIYIDEIDKIARKAKILPSPVMSAGKGATGAVEDFGKVLCPMYHLREEENIPSRSLSRLILSNILFICGGAFDGIDKIIEKESIKNPDWVLVQSSKMPKRKILICCLARFCRKTWLSLV